MRSVMITGASSGIGRATALHLAGSGWRVFAGIRKSADGDALVADAPPGAVLIPVVCDVVDQDSVDAAVVSVRTVLAGEPLDGFFSNAGIAAMGGESSAEATPLATLQRVMEVNYLGAVRAMQGFLPLLRDARGTVVVNSAMMTHTILPFNAGYAPSKAALEAWAVSLRREIEPYGVRVVIIRPAGVATPLEAKQDLSQIPADSPYPEQAAFLRHGTDLARQRADDPSMSPLRVAECVTDALDGRRSRYRMTGGGHLPIWMIGNLPASLQDRVVRRIVRSWTA
ncbi:MAG: SDR family NAD(P)-dependent oxidoreductase [Actinomycetota bacterium]